MKSILSTILILLLLTSKADAQKIHFTDTTNHWFGVHADASGPVGYLLTDAYYFGFLKDTVMSGAAYHIFAGRYNFRAALREDTVARKVYFRFLAQNIRGAYADTLEHTLYDYNLKVNDTFRTSYVAYNDSAVVTSIDSTLMNGVYHKVWHFGRAGGSLMLLGTIVEGLGSTDHPMWPASFRVFEDGYQLQCFSNRTGHPQPNPTIGLPFNGTSNFGPPLTDTFNNTTSCSLAVAETILAGNKVTVYPNPGGKDIVLKTEKPIANSRVMVYDIYGHVQFTLDMNGKSEVRIGEWLRVSGTYFYLLITSDNTVAARGRFVVR